MDNAICQNEYNVPEAESLKYNNLEHLLAGSSMEISLSFSHHIPRNAENIFQIEKG